MKYFLLAMLIGAAPVIAGDDILVLFPNLKPVPGQDQFYQDASGKKYDVDQLIEKALNARVAQLDKAPSEESMRNLLALYLRFGQDSEAFLPVLQSAKNSYPTVFEKVVNSLTVEQKAAVSAGVEAANEL